MFFKNFEYFLAIIEEGSISKASEREYISQPSLSKYLKRLESNLGVELFDRNSYPLKLTHTGERYYKYGIKVMELEKQLQREFTEICRDERGEIKFGLALWRGSHILPLILPYFKNVYPNITVSITEGKSQFLINELINERIDFALMNLPLYMDFSKIQYDILMEEEILLAGNINHPLVSQTIATKDCVSKFPSIDIKDLEEELFVITKQGQNLTNAISYLFSKKGLNPQNTFETENLTTAINLVSAGLGFTFIPEDGVRAEIIPNNIKVFSLKDSNLLWPLAIVYKKNTYVTNVSKLFIDSLKKHYIK